MVMLSTRSAVEPFHAMDILAEANRLKAAGHKVISLAVGQPGAPAPERAIRAAEVALRAGQIGYTDALGRADLRQGLADYYRRRHGTEVAAERIMVTTGSSAGFNLAFLALFEAGDAVAIARPGYPAYRNILKALGLVVIEVPVGPDTDYTLTPDSLERAARAAGVRLKGVLLASPANPTGTVTGRAALQRLALWCDDNGVSFISDEIYHGLTYGVEEASAVEFAPDAVVINSFSKYYRMTGWRIGWMVLPPTLVRGVECVAQSLYISAPELSQIAAMAALEAGDELEEYRAGCRANRDFLQARLPALGMPLLSPMDGAFYAYVDVSRFTNDSMEFARRLLAQTHVAATPGLDFDPLEGHRALRISYAGTLADLTDATDRIANWLA
ncbi:aminotransferase class I/II-fold pyridoxal phosphate-dependent enzyme [Agrobacterium vitis]|uniref:pyridoxal phosphate-dependent aminotransferase n=1 Tax=Rhizobium/Agrobacterium group TaxID=227290 RepID=UPI0012E6FF6E|nr:MULTISPECIES: aminotransferase class I/II-fold pyridoxal phosphate-dependent enzyme [Rhizobium/Agrobacterium group]MCF1474565.1 aminotransferase class I/II-fold pyridoxal phosphate-dependent enzyme [Allorhizobium ampelinum]MCF1481800.1 aminotransferase class I/II-fold pyridoxal phosphate-dependent enzyme [Allorhizobium ampelinum]MVA50816.1 aminotransferase class I/II-fold pyridoxal phosphate-dependent enzyme [Agrobacterium vitis]NSZ52567.1 aminotransferase class I/II-fold pyridoxal phosphate